MKLFLHATFYLCYNKKVAKEFPWLADSFALGLTELLLREAFLYLPGLPYHLLVNPSTC
jgi:hypothetical protein